MEQIENGGVAMESAEVDNQAAEPATANEQAESVSEDGAQSPEDRMDTLKNLLRKEYKEESTQYFKELLDKRFKKHDAQLSEAQEQAAQVDAILEAFGAESVEDLRKLARAESARKKADEEGLPEDAVLTYEEKLAKLEAENKSLKTAKQREEADRFLSTLEQGISEFSEKYGMDELELLSDDDLVEMVKDGKSVKQAFFGLYPDRVEEIMSAGKKSPARPSEGISGQGKPAKNTPGLSTRDALRMIQQVQESGRAIDLKTMKPMD